MKTVQDAQSVILNRVATALNLDSSTIDLLTGDPSAELPENFELPNADNLVTLEYIRSDKPTWDKIHKEVLASSMPKIEEAGRKVFIDAVGQSKFFDTKKISDAYNNDKHERSNQRLFAGLNAMIEQMKEAVNQAGSGPEDQKQKFIALQERANDLQSVVDGFESKMSEALGAKETELTKQILEMSLIQKAEGFGAKFPSDRMRQFWAKEMLEKADWKRENGTLVGFAKGTENPLTDPVKKTTVSPDDFLKADLIDFIPRNNGDGGDPKLPPKKTFEPGNPVSKLPEGIAEGSDAAKRYIMKMERREKREGATV